MNPFSVASPSVWNALPDSLRDPELTLDIFRASFEDLLLHVILDVSHVQRIRDFFGNALYKCSFYLLTFIYVNYRYAYAKLLGECACCLALFCRVM